MSGFRGCIEEGQRPVGVEHGAFVRTAGGAKADDAAGVHRGGAGLGVALMVEAVGAHLVG